MKKIAGIIAKVKKTTLLKSPSSGFVLTKYMVFARNTIPQKNCSELTGIMF